jgi:Ser/Thr protein kinase RdoA (MazF antagonist)
VTSTISAPTDDLAGHFGPRVAAGIRGTMDSLSGPTERSFPLRLEPLNKQKGGVYRIGTGTDARDSSIVVKRHSPDTARRNRRVVERWLPALGLQGAAPALLGAVAEDRADRIWLLYEEAPGRALESPLSTDVDAAAAVELIATLHMKAADHHLLPEIRREGEDLGISYFTANVEDALGLLEALRPPAVFPSAEQARIREGLRGRLRRLLDDAPRRAGLMAEAGGATTLLHGDLWTSNVFVDRADPEPARVRLIDWDHVGAGPIYYDLSTFLYRFPAAARPALLARYGAVAARSGWSLPPTAVANLLFETAECARYANRIIWPAIALLEEDAAWGWEELAEIEGWFRALEPVLQE